MAATSVNAALRYIRALFTGQKSEGQSDQSLLEQFVSQRDESAFAALLQRHGPMAMGVCMRVLRDEHLAEDALQATFLVLALKAGKLRAPGSLAGWLYGVALRLARKAKAQAVRSQRQVNRENPEPPPATPTEVSRREEKELLDEEMERLPDKYRLPLLLCYFEGRTHEEAAAQLGWTAGQVKGLLDRGRERLRFRLSRRGVTLSAAAGTLLTGTTLSAAVPRTLVVSTLQAVLKLISGQSLPACGVSGAVATLAKGELIMAPKKILLIVAMLFLTGTVAVGAGMWAGKGEDPGPGPAQVALEQAGDAQGKDGQKKDAEPEDPVIERLIEILKNSAMTDEERALACEALGKRGSKAKRALPEIAKFFGATDGEKDFETKLDGEQLKKIMAAAAAIGPKSKENFKILTTALRCQRQLSIRVEALDALGRFGANNQKTFDLLLKATKANSEKAPVGKALSFREAAVGALANFGATSNNDLKAKAKVELQLLAEIETDSWVRDAARAGLRTLEGAVAAARDEDLSPDRNVMKVFLDNNGNGEGTFTYQRGRVGGFTIKDTTSKQDFTIQEIKERGFTVEAAGRDVKVIARGAKPFLFVLKVAAKGGKEGAHLWVGAEYAPLTLSGLKEGKIERKVPAYGAKPLKLEMKVATGRAESVRFIGAKVDPEGWTLAADYLRMQNAKLSPEQIKMFRAQRVIVTINDSREVNPGYNTKGVESAIVVDAQSHNWRTKLTVALSEDKSAVIVIVGERDGDDRQRQSSPGAIPGIYDAIVRGRDATGRESSTQFSVILTK